MDTGRIYEEALRLWQAAEAGDLAAASWTGEASPGQEGLLLLGDNLALMAALAEQARQTANQARQPANQARQLANQPGSTANPPGSTGSQPDKTERTVPIVSPQMEQPDKTVRTVPIVSPIVPPFNLIYMDPPYFSNRDRQSNVRVKTPAGEMLMKAPAFSDTWKPKKAAGAAKEDPMEAYLAMLTPRLIAARELLAEDGSLWLHLDRRAVHYAKVMADAVFGGGDHLVNEVVWSYKSGGSSSRRFANKHDTLLFYAKSKRKYKFFPQEEKSYNRGLKPYRFKGVKEYRDDYGWVTIVPI
ncbi:MAG: hypothetical protein FWG03_10975 [Clostridiales bacterium]|nr:hypothetical protein [Clostridiales bacterium]